VRHRPLATIGLFAALAAGAVGLRLMAEPLGLAPPRDGVELELRAIRAASGATIGAALAASGVLLQSLLRNPLAAPSLLGLTSGASLGVMLSIYLGYLMHGVIEPHRPQFAAAILGACVSLAIVYAVAQRRGRIEPVRLILVGVVFSVMAGAGTMLLRHLMPDRGLVAAERWLLGSINDDVATLWIGAVAGVTVAGIAIGAALGRAMDAAALDDDEARSVGVRLQRLRIVLYLVAGVLTAGAVSLAGPIGFVGLICPHAVRLIGGPRHAPLVVGAALAGAALVVGADALVRLAPAEIGRIPIGVLTALLGGPAFLIVLRRQPGSA
jgi:iron complex transport system permease protein